MGRVGTTSATMGREFGDHAPGVPMTMKEDRTFLDEDDDAPVRMDGEPWFKYHRRWAFYWAAKAANKQGRKEPIGDRFAKSRGVFI